jgi:hypothetical protein
MSKPVIIKLRAYDIRLAEAQAEACAMGGESQIREVHDRAEKLREDQVVGQVGTIALHRYWFGHVEQYMMGRYFQNKMPWEGDGGEDIPGANIDVKTSLMRRSTDPMTYNLPIRGRERHAGWVYVLALLPLDYRESKQVFLMGWIGDSELPAEPKADGPLAGAFVMPVPKLNPLPPVAFNLFPR